MARKINYDDWSKEELIKEMRRIKETTYGLVWHRDLPEEKIDILINPDARTPNEMFPNEMAGRPFPVLEESKGKEIETDKSKPVNLLIEGDNYHSLAVFNFTHHEAIDLIYIDPPYNIGNGDFIYNDSRARPAQKDDPFRHSKWISFMEKRLKIAKRKVVPTSRFTSILSWQRREALAYSIPRAVSMSKRPRSGRRAWRNTLRLKTKKGRDCLVALS